MKRHDLFVSRRNRALGKKHWQCYNDEAINMISFQSERLDLLYLVTCRLKIELIILRARR